MNPPTKCLAVSPNRHYVQLSGVCIDLKHLSKMSGVSHSYLSRVFTGDRPLPRIHTAQVIAAALGMEWPDFIEALEDRVQRILAVRRERTGLTITPEPSPASIIRFMPSL